MVRVLGSTDICPICYDPFTGRPQTITECNHAFHTECLDDWIIPEFGTENTYTCPCCRKPIKIWYQGPDLPEFGEVLTTMFGRPRITVDEAGTIPTIITFKGPTDTTDFSEDEKHWVAWVHLRSGALWHYPAQELHMMTPNRSYGRLIFDNSLMKTDGMNDITTVWEAIVAMDPFSLVPCGGRLPQIEETDFIWIPGRDREVIRWRQSPLNLANLAKISPKDLRNAMAGKLVEIMNDVPQDHLNSTKQILETLPTLPRFTVQWEAPVPRAQLPTSIGGVRLIKYEDWLRNILRDDEDTEFDLPGDYSDDEDSEDDEVEVAPELIEPND